MDTRTMSVRIRVAVLVAIFAALPAGRTAQATIVRFATVVGNIDVRLYNQATPLSVANFLGYLNRGDYQNTMIHRSIPGFVIQGGGWKYDGTTQVEPQNFPQITSQPPVLNEPGISNLRGTLSYAKVGPPTGQQPTPQTINSATHEWFFNLANNSGMPPNGLDYQNGSFTVFGRVVGNGMNIADAIAALPIYGFQGAWSDAPMRNYTPAQYNDFVPVGGNNVVSMSISVLNYPKGDYNFDGKVDINDLNVWKNSFGSKTAAEADGNGNGVVDDADYTIWRDTFGQISGPGSGAAAAVPEPASVLLFVMAAAMILVSRIRRSREW
jgi:cyclophilin family peptidyl-prolyl cis-trans isomerase